MIRIKTDGKAVYLGRYDDIDRLTGMSSGAANENYAFDVVGNRTSSHKSSTYGYQPNNKLTSTQNTAYSLKRISDDLSAKSWLILRAMTFFLHNRAISRYKLNSGNICRSRPHQPTKYFERKNLPWTLP